MLEWSSKNAGTEFDAVQRMLEWSSKNAGMEFDAVQRMRQWSAVLKLPASVVVLLGGALCSQRACVIVRTDGTHCSPERLQSCTALRFTALHCAGTELQMRSHQRAQQVLRGLPVK